MPQLQLRNFVFFVFILACVQKELHIVYIFIKGSLDEKLPSYEVLKMLRE